METRLKRKIIKKTGTMECYIVLYSQEGYFLTFTKRDLTYFSNETNEIYLDGVSIENGPGQFAFPGGMFNEVEEPFSACLRKFTEKCGKEITFEFFPLYQPQFVLKNMVVNKAEYEVLTSILSTLSGSYHTLFLKFTIDNLKLIQNSIANINIAQANRARIGIYNNVLQNYDQVFKYNPFCPLNDELFNSELWQIDGEINKIRLLAKNKVTKRYYEMIAYLAKDILNVLNFES